MGTSADKKMRKTLLRQDNPEIRATIKTARSKIYEKGYAVTSEVVEQILKEKSLVPADVGCHLYISSLIVTCWTRTHFQAGSPT